jgi:hypothetical protein
MMIAADFWLLCLAIVVELVARAPELPGHD